MAVDISAYERLVDRLDIADLDLRAAFAEQPLAADALRCVRYMHDIESHTICYLRNLLVTDAHADPEITTFFTLWNYEEHWHGRALGDVLAAHGQLSGPDRVARVRAAHPRLDRLRPLAFMAGSAVLPGLASSPLRSHRPR